MWIVDSTPVECARSRETVKRSDLAGWAGYGYCRSHSRFYWGHRKTPSERGYSHPADSRAVNAGAA
ncbi:hypothetical protein GCM10010383_08700 [Streptomyces lomondensis]|uniref:Transposase n=1 Tax=Streptomyces lomondensis TaxID=68229 RepID=A0ABQ2WWL6_9ACTN|nr:hypothetical protein GCM10010383_08700 [Streptomyces lomondensis]